MAEGTHATFKNVADLETATLRQFGSCLKGDVILPGDAGYEPARSIYNALIERRPGLIAHCADSSDVMAAVRFARENELLVAVRAGGHSVAGHALCDGGMMIDLSPMKGIRVDPSRTTATAEPGLKWGEFDAATQPHGLATTGGTNTDTGIAGLTLGGGMGWLMAKHGLSCDNLLSAQVLSADGRLLTANDAENPDLFWGLRGGGGNFGVVTSFEYRLHQLGPVLAGPILYPAAASREVLRFFRDFTVDAPDELTCQAGLLTAPDGTTPVCAVVVCYAGPRGEGERALDALKSFGRPLDDQIRWRPYAEIQSLLDEVNPPGRLNYWKSSFLRELSDAAIDAIVEHCAEMPSPHSAMLLEELHGAVSRVSPAQTAFAARQARLNFSIFSIWTDPAQSVRQIQWARKFHDDMQPFFGDLTYVNYLDRGDDNRVREAYGPNYERLLALKRKYDPTNFFRLNQNLDPGGS